MRTRPSEVLEMTRTLARAARIDRAQPNERKSIGWLLARNAVTRAQSPAVTADGETVTWAELNARANRVAARLRDDFGIRHGDAVGLMMENRISFLSGLLGICKLGAVAGLFNTNQRGDVLIHSATTIQARAVIVGAELSDAIADVRDRMNLPADGCIAWMPDPGNPDLECPDWARPIDDQASDVSSADPAETAEITLDDPCFYIFTSGTTGLPKAAVVSNARFYFGIQGFGLLTLNLSSTDRMYNCLPLYHTTGLMVGWGSTLLTGASSFIRRKFSASAFLEEVRRENANVFVYIGELCRYLLHTPARSDDHRNPLRKCVGNGLRPDIWMDFKRRFGLHGIYELYGASEGNSGFVNAFNKDCTIGFGVLPHILVRYDVDNDEIVRDANGRCIVVPRGEPGLLLNEISEQARFDGYTNAEATEKKIVRDVLAPGDAWFNSGDLLRQIDVGFAFGQKHYQFVDRTGDTFRWKGENCSTNEVGEIINDHPQVQTTNVYGVEVPGTDGKAGMAAITFDPDVVKDAGDVDWDSLTAHIDSRLAAYARPIFIRVSSAQDTTSTFKLLKPKLREQAFRPALCDGDAIYVRRPGADRYEPLDDEFLARIEAGEAGY